MSQRQSAFATHLQTQINRNCCRNGTWNGTAPSIFLLAKKVIYCLGKTAGAEVSDEKGGRRTTWGQKCHKAKMSQHKHHQEIQTRDPPLRRKSFLIQTETTFWMTQTECDVALHSQTALLATRTNWLKTTEKQMATRTAEYVGPGNHTNFLCFVCE